VSLLHQLSRPSHVRVSVGFSLCQMDFSPVGESMTFRYGNCQAKCRVDLILTCILFTILYFVSSIASANLTSFLWQEGGAPALTLWLTVWYFDLLTPESSSEVFGTYFEFQLTLSEH
jgi:hypothetical protein